MHASILLESQRIIKFIFQTGSLSFLSKSIVAGDRNRSLRQKLQLGKRIATSDKCQTINNLCKEIESITVLVLKIAVM